MTKMNNTYFVAGYREGSILGPIDGDEVARLVCLKKGLISSADMYWADLQDGDLVHKVMAWPKDEGKFITRWDVFKLPESDQRYIQTYLDALRPEDRFELHGAPVVDFDPERAAESRRETYTNQAEYDEALEHCRKHARHIQRLANFWFQKFEGEEVPIYRHDAEGFCFFEDYYNIAFMYYGDDDIPYTRKDVKNLLKKRNLNPREYLFLDIDDGGVNHRVIVWHEREDPWIRRKDFFEPASFDRDQLHFYKLAMQGPSYAMDIAGAVEKLVASGKISPGYAEDYTILQSNQKALIRQIQDFWNSPQYGDYVVKREDCAPAKVSGELYISETDSNGNHSNWSVIGIDLEHATMEACGRVQEHADSQGEDVEILTLSDLQEYYEMNGGATMFYEGKRLYL